MSQLLPGKSIGSIEKVAIHPSIGIARIGNSGEEFFIGPEVVDPDAQGHSYYRAADGSLKRQAARFRIYGYDADGRLVGELTPDADVAIRWTVHLANQKSAWYQFHLPLDLPEADAAPSSLLRNAGVSARADLIIDPGPRSVAGPGQVGGSAQAFDTGEFMGVPVYLGELRTDEAGRLLVLGGRGVSASRTRPPSPPSSLTGSQNNETWHDDTSDGPVRAKVTIGDREFDALPAWVIVAPPNYAPQQKSVRTIWDVMRDVFLQANPAKAPAQPSFNDDIRPIFERLANLQWVNAGYAAAFGWDGITDLTSPAMLRRLSDPSLANLALRQAVARQFRDPRPAPSGDPVAAGTPNLLPWQFGDVAHPDSPTPRQYSSLTATQLQFLKQNWVAGDFKADYPPPHPPYRDIASVPLPEQPDMLTRAALEFCIADAFHSGIEMTWNVRSATMYMPGEAFRFLPAPAGWTEPRLGLGFYPQEVVKVVGPLGAQVPGGVTRWLGVPWQADTAACKTVRATVFDPYAPSWWPARVPNHVITPGRYHDILHGSLPSRLAAFAGRDEWMIPLFPAPSAGNDRPSDAGEAGVLNAMVHRFAQMGIVAEVEGPGLAELPAKLQVSDRPA